MRSIMLSGVVQCLPMRRVWCVSCVALWLLSSAAWAKETAPLVPVMDPPKAAELLTRFHDALGAGLKAGGMQVMDPSSVRSRLQRSLESAGCFEGTCLSVAREVHKTHLFATSFIKSVGKNYTIEVRLYSGSTVYAKSEGRCDICTVAEVLEATTKLATQTGKKGGAPPPLPPEPTPLPKPPPPKPKPLPKVPPPKPKPVPQVAAPTSQPTEPAEALQPVEEPAKRWPLWPGIALAGGGVVFLAVGIPLLAIDGEGTNCVGESLPDYGNCEDLYETSAGGWLLTSGGLVALAASSVMFYLHFASKPEEQPKVSFNNILVSPTRTGGVILGAGGSF